MDPKKKAIIQKTWFIDSKSGNIKDDYFFEKKIGTGGYGAVYLAKNKKTSKQRVISNPVIVGNVVAVKAIQKLKVKDYESFITEMTIMQTLVSLSLMANYIRTIPTSSNCMRHGRLIESAFWLQNTVRVESSSISSPKKLTSISLRLRQLLS